MDNYLAGLVTESINPATEQIDSCTTLDMVKLINQQDALVAEAVARESGHIAQAIDLIWPRLKRGGRLIYVGAGTSGRLGVLDASECVPTFGVDPDMVQAYIAGGDDALRHPAEGAEDNEREGIALIERLHIDEDDAVVGISASGSAAYVLAALGQAKKYQAAVIGLCTNAHSKLEQMCDVVIAPLTGPEVISGSTRMKSGTAQKMVLNMLTTCSMIKLGKVYGNLMVDLKISNKKLEERAKRLIIYATGLTSEEAASYLKAAGGYVKLAILMQKSSLGAEEAQALLDECDGQLREAITLSRKEKV